MARLTEKSIVDVVEFENEMDRIRGCGHSICDEESEIGAATVAVPIVLPEGTVRSALAVIGPRDRILALAEDGLVEDMARTAAVIAGLEAGVGGRRAGAGPVGPAGREDDGGQKVVERVDACDRPARQLGPDAAPADDDRHAGKLFPEAGGGSREMVSGSVGGAGDRDRVGIVTAAPRRSPLPTARRPRSGSLRARRLRARRPPSAGRSCAAPRRRWRRRRGVRVGRDGRRDRAVTARIATSAVSLGRRPIEGRNVGGIPEVADPLQRRRHDPVVDDPRSTRRLSASATILAVSFASPDQRLRSQTAARPRQERSLRGRIVAAPRPSPSVPIAVVSPFNMVLIFFGRSAAELQPTRSGFGDPSVAIRERSSRPRPGATASAPGRCAVRAARAPRAAARPSRNSSSISPSSGARKRWAKPPVSRATKLMPITRMQAETISPPSVVG